MPALISIVIRLGIYILSILGGVAITSFVMRILSAARRLISKIFERSSKKDSLEVSTAPKPQSDTLILPHTDTEETAHQHSYDRDGVRHTNVSRWTFRFGAAFAFGIFLASFLFGIGSLEIFDRFTQQEGVSRLLENYGQTASFGN